MAGPTDEELEILLLEFPHFSCICELCDCGRHRHHKNCMKKSKNIKKREWCPITTNQDTFKAFTTRPRSSKRPPPTPLNRHPPPMVLTTNQRDDFKPRDLPGRVQPFIPVDEHYEPEKTPFNFKTYYQDEFKMKSHLPNINPPRPPTQSRYHTRSAVKFDARTTNKEYFKKWVPQPTVSFGELPSFTGSLLYPDQKGRLPNTTTQHSFPGAYAPKQDAIDFGYGSLKWEGDMDLLTTNMDTYQGKKGQRAPIIVKDPKVSFQKRGKFMGETQKMRDFPEYKEGLPRRADRALPAPETIQLKFDNTQSFDTEQRLRFKGHDPKEHPKPEPFITGLTKYTPPKVKFETQTNQKLDYALKEMEPLKPAVPPPQLYTDKRPRLDDQTMYKVYHKDFEPKARVRHGDFHEANKYVPPKDKFEVISTTQATFTPQKWEAVHTYVPQQHIVDKDAKHDFTTVTMETYKAQPFKMCKAQMFLLQQKLKTEKFNDEELKKIRENVRKLTTSNSQTVA